MRVGRWRRFRVFLVVKAIFILLWSSEEILNGFLSDRRFWGHDKKYKHLKMKNTQV
jgi:hypothetical protein